MLRMYRSSDSEHGMRRGRKASLLVALLAMLLMAPPSFAQGKSGEKGKQGEVKRAKQQGEKHGKSQASKQADRGKPGPAQAAKKEHRGKQDKSAATKKDDRGKPDRVSGKSERFDRTFAARDVKPSLRRFAVSNRAPERIAAGVLSRGHARGLGDDAVIIRENGDRISLFNRDGILLVDLDEQRARNLGNWRVRPHYDEVTAGAPSFCRSGEGHPVFGREWCLQKGFGLGDYRDLRWGRTTDARDIVFRQVDRGTLARAVLIGVLGDVVFNRLGLHALTLGYNDPLTGVWLGEPTGPQVLRVTSGAYPIAEIYDGDRDNRADALVVALRPWY